MSNERREITLQNAFAVIELPEDAVELKLVVKVMLDGELQTVERNMTAKEVRHAFKEADDGYIPSDAVFAITEEGVRYLEERERQQ